MSAHTCAFIDIMPQGTLGNTEASPLADGMASYSYAYTHTHTHTYTHLNTHTNTRIYTHPRAHRHPHMQRPGACVRYQLGRNKSSSSLKSFDNIFPGVAVCVWICVSAALQHRRGDCLQNLCVCVCVLWSPP